MALRAISAWILPRRRRLGNGVALDPDVEGGLLETLMVVAIVGVLVGIAFEGYRPALLKATMTEAANLMVIHKTDIVTELAVTGRLPEAVPLRYSPSDYGGKYFDSVDWYDGEIVLPLRRDAVRRMPVSSTSGADAPLTLSFRVARSEPGSLVVLCGNSVPPAGFDAAPARHTTVPEEFLPFFCRI